MKIAVLNYRNQSVDIIERVTYMDTKEVESFLMGMGYKLSEVMWMLAYEDSFTINYK